MPHMIQVPQGQGYRKIRLTLSCWKKWVQRITNGSSSAELSENRHDLLAMLEL